MISFYDLEVGTKVIVHRHGWGGARSMSTVERVTKMLIIVSGGDRFMRKNGRDFGGKYLTRSYLTIPDADELAQVRTTSMLNRVCNPSSYSLGLNDSELERIVAIIKESEERNALSNS